MSGESVSKVSRTVVVITALASASVLQSPAHAAAGDAGTFGANTFGQLGNGAVDSTPRPDPTTVLGSASDVAAGREHSLAIVSGRVWAWGADVNGAVGDGGSFVTAVPAPQQLTSAMSGVDSVATGHYHSLALDKDTNTVWAWGWNSRGQIGPAAGTMAKVASPLKVTLPSGSVGMIAGGRSHSLALVGGRVFAWGDNSSGQLGRTPNDVRNSTPALVPGLPLGVTWIAGGRDSSFAIAGGVLYAWGNNVYGQLGDGTQTQRTTPVRISGVTVSQVESGADHTVAVLTNGTIAAWGRNRFGQLGSSGSAIRTRPAAVAGLSGITEVRVGRDHNIAMGSGRFYAWGRNDGGQLGLNAGTTPSTSTPTLIPAAAGAHDAGGGQVHTVILR